MITDAVLLLARLLITTMFVVSAYDKFRLVPREVAAIRSLHLPMPKTFEWLTGLFEATACVLLIVGPCTRVAALLLALFTLAVSFALLRFWSAEAPESDTAARRTDFFANLTVTGGLLYVAVLGPGAYVLFDWY